MTYRQSPVQSRCQPRTLHAATPSVFLHMHEGTVTCMLLRTEALLGTHGMAALPQTHRAQFPASDFASPPPPPMVTTDVPSGGWFSHEPWLSQASHHALPFTRKSHCILDFRVPVPLVMESNHSTTSLDGKARQLQDLG